jgi:hypothetical protein
MNIGMRFYSFTLIVQTFYIGLTSTIAMLAREQTHTSYIRIPDYPSASVVFDQVHNCA